LVAVYGPLQPQRVGRDVAGETDQKPILAHVVGDVERLAGLVDRGGNGLDVEPGGPTVGALDAHPFLVESWERASQIPGLIAVPSVDGDSRF
jgi:hypothetical protein